ncbi:MAG: thioredoxin [Chlorobiales bacterium]|nr:thioredoxin [Chlorobiales bacterium]
MQKEAFSFGRDVLEKSKDIPVLVDFWAEWCGPCRVLGPVLEKVAAKHEDELVLVKINTEEYPDIAREYGIMSIPSVKLFVGGDVADDFVGALPEKQIEQWLKKSLPGKYADQLKQVEELVIGGDEAGAASILEEILKHEPKNIRATAILMKLKLFSEPKIAASFVETLEGEQEYTELIESAKTISGLLLKNAADFPQDEVKGLYLGAVDELRKKEFDTALVRFIEVIRENRYYDDDGARKACIAVFKYLGEDHPVTLRHRKVFDRALY